jgi:hypothetical protein
MKPPENEIPSWPLITGIAVIAFGTILIELRSSILLSIVFIILGTILILAWYTLYSKKKIQLAQKYGPDCICQICNHEKPLECVKEKCKCCIIMKENKIIGHSNNPLQ